MNDRKWIPLQQPWISDAEIKAVTSALVGGHLVGDGVICRRVEKAMEDLFGVKHVLLTTSCTHAMELAALSLGISQDDEVILPSFTMSSTATAVVLRGARPVFAEICPDTLTLDPEDVRRKITPRTRAIMPVHYAGVSCDMDKIMDIANEHGLYVIEDAAQGVDARYKGRYLGTIGHIGCYSFHATKNITCGEGGAFLTNDDEIARRAEVIREKGTNRSAFLRGEVDKYTWVSSGSSYVLSDLLASVLEAQLAKRSEIKSIRKAIWERYYDGLRPLAMEGMITLPSIPENRESNYHIFFFRVRTTEQSIALGSVLRAKGIGATFHYVPLHSSPFNRQLCGRFEDLPITEHLSATLLRLPLYPTMLPEQVEIVLTSVQDAIRHKINV